MNNAPTTATKALELTTRYQTNSGYTQAILTFQDGSEIHFEHNSRDNRWARATQENSQANAYCHLLQNFRLNAKHLQLFFEDGSDAEFFLTT